MHPYTCCRAYTIQARSTTNRREIQNPELFGTQVWFNAQQSTLVPLKNIFPGQYFSAGPGKQNCSPGQFSFHDTNEILNLGNSIFMIQRSLR
jgi:hypothetical protein